MKWKSRRRGLAIAQRHHLEIPTQCREERTPDSVFQIASCEVDLLIGVHLFDVDLLGGNHAGWPAIKNLLVSSAVETDAGVREVPQQVLGGIAGCHSATDDLHRGKNRPSWNEGAGRIHQD